MLLLYQNHYYQVMVIQTIIMHHAPLSRLGNGRGDVVIVGGNVPELVMMPTGEFHGQGGQ